MECVMLLLYCLIYQEISEYAYEKRSGEWFFWECTRFLCWLNSFSIHLQIILCYMNSFTSCFSTNFCIYFQRFRGLAGRVRWLLSEWFGFFRENFSNRLGLKSRIIKFFLLIIKLLLMSLASLSFRKVLNFLTSNFVNSNLKNRFVCFW